jgi:hypothetical protein
MAADSFICGGDESDQINTATSRCASILSTYNELQSSIDGVCSAGGGDEHIRGRSGSNVKRKGRETEAGVCSRGVRIKQDDHAKPVEWEN